MQYYMHIGGQQLGPFEESELIAHGLMPETPVWAAGMPDWKPANQVPELAPLLFQQPLEQQYQQPPYQQASYQQPQYEQPQYEQPQYQQQQWGNTPAMPDTYLVWGILVTIFCCLPFGIVSIVKASQVSSLYAAGRYQDAQEASQSAKKWALWGVAGWAVMFIVYIIFIAVAGFSLAGLEGYMGQ